MLLLRTILLRLATTAVTLFGVAVIVFVVIRVVPGNPVAMMLPPGPQPEDVARLTALYGLDKSIPEQFLIWAGGVLNGDFGTSITARQPVLDLVLGRLPATLELSIMALVIAILLGGLAAVTGTRLRGSRTEAAIDVGNGVALSVPDFLWGLVLVLLFGVLMPISTSISGRYAIAATAVRHRLLPVRESPQLRFDLWADIVSHMFMPALALAIRSPRSSGNCSSRASRRRCISTTSRWPAPRVWREPRHPARGTAQRHPADAHAGGVQFTIPHRRHGDHRAAVSYEGLGNMAIDAVINRDLPLIQGIVILFAVIFTAVNLAVDLFYSALNPRLRHA